MLAFSKKLYPLVNKTIHVVLVFAVLASAFFAPLPTPFTRSAQAKTITQEDLPAPLLVTNSAQELTQAGCAEANLENPSKIKVPDGVSYTVRPSGEENQIFFCSEEIMTSLNQSDGQVKGAIGGVGGAAGGCAAGAAIGVWGFGVGALVGCAIGGILGGAAGSVAGGYVADTIGSYFLAKAVSLINWVIILLTGLGAWLLWLAANLVGFAISPTKFATHDFVTTGWPFIQGIANLGFILALLAIALSTALRIESFSARRMIPRLLIGALLINFSLLIGTLVVDLSRLVMAVEVRALIDIDDITEIANAILGESHLDEAVSNSISGINPLSIGLESAWTGLLQSLFAAVLIWGSAIAFMIIAIMLVVRYIAILILLVLSPLAYLAIAMPRAERIATQWWSNFLKYVLYGPIVLFVLALLLQALKAEDFFGRQGQAQNASDQFFQHLVAVVVVITLLIIAATAGRYFGVAGANATVGFFNRRRQQASRLAGMGAAALGGYVARPAIERVQAGREARKEYQQKRSDIRKDYYASGAKKKYNEQLRNYQQKYQTPEQKAQAQAAQKIDSKTAFKTSSELHSSSELTPPVLTNSTFVANLPQGTLEDLMSRGSDQQVAAVSAALASMKSVPPNVKEVLDVAVNKSVQIKNATSSTPEQKENATKVLRALAKNQELVSAMDDGQKANMLSTDDKDISKDFLETLGKVNSKKEPKTKTT